MAKPRPKTTKPSVTYGPKRPPVPIKDVKKIEKVKLPKR
jgi:hypothetical protein